MSNRVIIDQTINTVTTDQCPDVHNSVVVNNDIPSIIDVIENVTNIVTVVVPGPQGPAGPQGQTGAGGDITGSEYYVAIYKNPTALFTGSLYQSASFTSIRNATAPEDPNNPDILYVNGDGVETFNLISARGNLDDFVQVNVQNYSIGGNASSDIVATKDDGTDSFGYVNMGINGSQYSNSSFVGAASDAYVYSLTNGNLYIGNAEPNREVIIFNGGLDAISNSKIWIHDQGTIGINTGTYNTANPPSLQIAQANLTTYNLIQARGEVDSYLQTAITNAIVGPNASADMVAYNDIDPVDQLSGFIDVGINSTAFSDPIDYPGWNGGDSYVYSDAPRLIIGGAASSTEINLYAGGIDPNVNSKLILRSSNTHSMTGSLNISGSVTAQSFTGSLNGTASFALNAVTSSFAESASYAPNIYNRDGVISSNRIIDVNNKTLTFSNTNNVYYSSSAGTFVSLQASSNTAFLSVNYYDSGSNIVGGWGYGNSNVISPVYRSKMYFAGTTVPFSIIMNSVETTRFYVNGNVKIQNGGTFTDNGYRLQVSSQSTSSGSLWVSGSSVITGSLTVTEGITGSLFGTSSWALNAITASYALNVSGTIANAVSASFATTAISSSYPIAISGFTIYTPYSGIAAFSTNNNIFLGNNIGTSTSTFGNNIFIGQQTGLTATNVYQSQFIGYNAGYQATNANNSNFLGYAAGYQATNADNSNFIGGSAGYQTTNANSSNFLGGFAGSQATNAKHSNFLGFYAGYRAASASYSNMQGYLVGSDSVSASYSTLIGYKVGLNPGGNTSPSIGSNNIIIGTNITIENGRQDSINLGSLIFGTGSYSTTSGNPFSGSANGRIGINQPIPIFNLDVSGSGGYTNGLTVTGSLIAPTITGSLQGTSSWAQKSITSSISLNAITSSLALTASSADNFVVRNSLTASNALINGTITAQTLVVQTVSSSIVYSSGSNIFGNNLTNTQVFTGSVSITGSLTVNGNNVILSNQTSSMSVATASLAQTASYVVSAISASYASTASIAVSSSYALTASYVSGSSTTSVTASYALTSSYATNFYVSGTLSVNSASLLYQQNLSVPTGSYQVIASAPTASYRAAFFDYVMFSGSVGRAGTIYSIWSASYAEYYENYTGDVGGSTAGVTLQAAISGSNIQLQATASNNAWTIRSLIRLL